MSTSTYDQVLDAARSGTRAVVDHLPLEAIADQLDRVPLDRVPLDLVPLDRLRSIGWDDLAIGDVALDDVLDEVATTARRHPVAIAAVIVATVLATCGVAWAVKRRRRRDDGVQTELSLAGVA